MPHAEGGVFTNVGHGAEHEIGAQRRRDVFINHTTGEAVQPDIPAPAGGKVPERCGAPPAGKRCERRPPAGEGAVITGDPSRNENATSATTGAARLAEGVPAPGLGPAYGSCF